MRLLITCVISDDLTLCVANKTRENGCRALRFYKNVPFLIQARICIVSFNHVEQTVPHWQVDIYNGRCVFYPLSSSHLRQPPVVGAEMKSY